MAGNRRTSVSRAGRIASGAAFAIAATAALLALIGLPALAIAAFSLAGLWRRLGALEAAA